jgi:hypothetical protein
MTSLRRAPRAAAAAAGLSLLLLSLFPAAASAAGASITQTSATNCAGGVVEFQLDASGLTWGDPYIFEFGFRPDGSGGYAEYSGWVVTIDSTGTWSMVFTLTGQTVSGGEVADFWVTSVWTLEKLASASATLQCRPPMPTSASQCKNGGWAAWSDFRNQGDCVSFVTTGGANVPAGTAGARSGR